MKQWTTRAGTRIIKILGGRSNVFLISCNGINLLIDTSPAFMAKRLQKNLRKHLRGNLDFLVLTHTHFDHAANTHLIKKIYHPKIVVHNEESRFLSSGDSPLPAGTNLFSSWLVRNFGRRVSKIVRYTGTIADINIDKETSLSEYGINVRILPTPGHTAGSLSIIVDHELALVGDALFGAFRGSCLPPFADDTQELIMSWQLLLNTGCDLFLPSHGGQRTRTILDSSMKKEMGKYDTMSYN